MSLADIKAQLYGGMAAKVAGGYEPRTKLAMALQEMIGLVSGAAPGNPIVLAITAASAPVMRKVDDQPEDEQVKLLAAVQTIVNAGLDGTVNPDQFRAIMHEQGASLKGLLGK